MRVTRSIQENALKYVISWEGKLHTYKGYIPAHTGRERASNRTLLPLSLLADQWWKIHKREAYAVKLIIQRLQRNG